MNIALMRNELVRMKASEYETFCAHLTAYAESRFYNDRRQLMQDGVNYTVGMFQQSARWGWTGLTNIRAATAELLVAFRKKQLFNNPVPDCWQVQKWNAPDYQVDMQGFLAAKETKNYLNCSRDIDKIRADPFYFTNGGKSQ